MASKTRAKRTVWKGDVVCTHCGKKNFASVKKKVIEPSVKAVTEIIVEVSADPELDLQPSKEVTENIVEVSADPELDLQPSDEDSLEPEDVEPGRVENCGHQQQLF